MSKHAKKHQTGNSRSTSATLATKRSPNLAVYLVAAFIALSYGLWRWKSKPGEATPSASTAGAPQSTNVTPQAASAASDFQKLVGKWRRPDGGYVIEIRTVDGGGRMNAGYFNPKPINVSRAEASKDGAALKVFIELRDVNYPGSTYTLVYDPADNQLKGIYYQAALEQRYEVVFEKMN